MPEARPFSKGSHIPAPRSRALENKKGKIKKSLPASTKDSSQPKRPVRQNFSKRARYLEKPLIKVSSSHLDSTKVTILKMPNKLKKLRVTFEETGLVENFLDARCEDLGLAAELWCKARGLPLTSFNILRALWWLGALDKKAVQK